MRIFLIVSLSVLSTVVFAKDYAFDATLVLTKNGTLVDKRETKLVLREPLQFGDPLFVGAVGSDYLGKVEHFVYEQLPLVRKNFQFYLEVNGLAKEFEIELPKGCALKSAVRLSVAEITKIIKKYKVIGAFSDAQCEDIVLSVCLNKFANEGFEQDRICSLMSSD